MLQLEKPAFNIYIHNYGKRLNYSGLYMKKLTSSVYTFEKLISSECLYVDKTEYIWKLLEQPYGTFFFARPRRFGKSLTLSTLKAIFQGKKELFQGLALESKPYDWKTYPVIHLDLGNCDASDAEHLKQYLIETLDAIAKTCNINLVRTGVSGRFTELIETMATNTKVVILIDEYDKPILDNAVNPQVESIREVLEGLYSVVKTTEPYQRFVLLTGVSKFSKVSVFSRLNNLTDISMRVDYATMLGYTQEELETNFAEHIDHTAKHLQLSREELLSKLKEWYNGYRFEENAVTVYNPVSIAKFFESGGKFHNYWFETGTPSFLIDMLKEKDIDLSKLENFESVADDFATYEIGDLQVLPLLVQTGYLTISKSYEKFGITCYILDFPNREVRESFSRRLVQRYSCIPGQTVTTHLLRLLGALQNGNMESFFDSLKVFFANIPYNIQIKNERYYQSIFHTLFTLIGVSMQSETFTNQGRIDAVVQTDERIYIFEFKLDGSAEDALKQIKEKSYHEKFLDSGKEIILIGANFSSEKRSIEKWLSEPVIR